MRVRPEGMWLKALLPWLLGVSGCGGPTQAEVEIPFDPSGTWEATVQGQLRESPFTGPLVVGLQILAVSAQSPGAPYLQVELGGSWEWGGVTGPVEGFWDTPDRPDQPNSGCASGVQSQCSLRLILDAPWPDYCAEPSDVAPHVPILAQGWFEGAARIVAPHLQGQYWQGHYYGCMAVPRADTRRFRHQHRAGAPVT